ncbi:MAG TPA: VOC family protein [Kofleriaceae bacterium]|nr:VOC family protein [Kofleriaceae bacterium]
MAPPRLALVILAVRDRARMTAFYRRVLEWSQVVDAPVYAELQSPDGLRLGLYAEEGFGRNIGAVPEPSPPITRTELYLQCDDLHAAIERAEEAGARPLSPLGPRDWGDEAAYFADPEGNVLVLAKPLPR